MSDANKSVREPHDTNTCRESNEVLVRFGDKWTSMVVGALTHGPTRYGELRRLIEGISQRMLTLTLKGLEEDGFVLRTVHPTVPPRVDYELTELGKTLLEPLAAIRRWTIEHRPAMLAAREAYAKANASKLKAGT